MTDKWMKRQQEYIESVDGQAHMSAVEIIGELEDGGALLAERTRRAERRCDELRQQLVELAAVVERLDDDECGDVSVKRIAADILAQHDERVRAEVRAEILDGVSAIRNAGTPDEVFRALSSIEFIISAKEEST